MTRIHRKSDDVHLTNLARKARRRGDPAEAARWLRLLALHQACNARNDAAIQREIEQSDAFLRQDAELQKIEEARRRSRAIERGVEHNS